MPLVLKGVMQAPVTPFRDDFSLDVETLEKATDFHVRTGATGITWPYHKSESLNMTIAERKAGAEAVVRVVAGRVPVAIHVSALAVNDSLELARHAQRIGADCVIAITPYFWRTSPQAIYDYFVWLGTSIELPLLAYTFAGLSRRRGDDGGPPRTADRASAEFHRREGSELQQRALLLAFALRAFDASGFRDADRRRIPAAVDPRRRCGSSSSAGGSARTSSTSCIDRARRASGRKRASAIRSTVCGRSSATSIRRRSKAGWS